MTMYKCNYRWPLHSGGLTTASWASNAVTIDASGEKAGAVFNSVEDFTLVAIHTVANTITTSGNISVRIESPDASASMQPSGTLWATSTEKASTTLSTAGTWYRIALDASATIADGDQFWVVLGHTGDSFNGTICPYHTNIVQNGGGISTNNTGSWGTITTGCPVMGLERSDGTIVGVPMAFPARRTTTMTTSTAGTYIGGTLLVPFDATLYGYEIMADLNSAGRTATVKLLVNNQTAFTDTIDSDYLQSLNSMNLIRRITSTDYSIKAGDCVKVLIAPDSAYTLELDGVANLTTATYPLSWHQTRVATDANRFWAYYTSSPNLASFYSDTSRIPHVALWFNEIGDPTENAGATKITRRKWA